LRYISVAETVGIFNYFYVIALRVTEFREITQNNAITPFKIIQGQQFWHN